MIELNLNPNTQKQAENLSNILDDEFLVSDHNPDCVFRARVISCSGEPLQLVFDYLPAEQGPWRQFHLKPEDADRLAALLFKFRESHIRWREL